MLHRWLIPVLFLLGLHATPVQSVYIEDAEPDARASATQGEGMAVEVGSSCDCRNREDADDADSQDDLVGPAGDIDLDDVLDDGDDSGVAGDSLCNSDSGDCDDNCPCTWNPDQIDSDGDGVGDACDECPGFDDWLDMDEDCIPDACDADISLSIDYQNGGSKVDEGGISLASDMGHGVGVGTPGSGGSQEYIGGGSANWSYPGGGFEGGSRGPHYQPPNLGGPASLHGGGGGGGGSPGGGTGYRPTTDDLFEGGDYGMPQLTTGDSSTKTPPPPMIVPEPASVLILLVGFCLIVRRTRRPVPVAVRSRSRRQTYHE